MAGGSVAKSVNGKGSTTRDIVAKLWNLCNVLRDDGITYTDYVTELTFLLFLKMLAETGHEERLPKTYRWEKLDRAEGLDQLEYYRRLLLDLGNPKISKDPVVLSIFTDAQTKLRKPTNLKALTDAIDKLDWFSAREEGLGNLYEGLLEKNAAEKKSGAGQYFTPRPLIDCIIRLVKPQPGELIQDPAAGTGGFLVAADRYIKDHTDDLYKLSEKGAFFRKRLTNAPVPRAEFVLRRSVPAKSAFHNPRTEPSLDRQEEPSRRNHSRSEFLTGFFHKESRPRTPHAASLPAKINKG